MTEGHTERLEAALDGKYRIERKLGEGGMASLRVPGRGRGRWPVRADFDDPLPDDVVEPFGAPEEWRLLLDTHVLIWWDEGAKLSEATVEAVRAADQVFVSAVSGWEIAIKASLRRIETTQAVGAAVSEIGLRGAPAPARAHERAGRAALAPSRPVRSHAHRAGTERAPDAGQPGSGVQRIRHGAAPSIEARASRRARASCPPWMLLTA